LVHVVALVSSRVGGVAQTGSVEGTNGDGLVWEVGDSQVETESKADHNGLVISARQRRGLIHDTRRI
jgi:hypothetical protein